jgi:hypothetical protein
MRPIPGETVPPGHDNLVELTGLTGAKHGAESGPKSRRCAGLVNPFPGALVAVGLAPGAELAELILGMLATVSG